MTRQAIEKLPKLGLGLGLRNAHFSHILENWPDIDWFEAISENFMDSGGQPRHVLRQIAKRYPVVFHGVSLSIGSYDDLNWDYLKTLKSLFEEIEPAWVSDHLCWTGVMGKNSHDLLPMPLTPESLFHVSERIHQVQDYLSRPLILENPSSYVTFRHNVYDEPEFLRELCTRTGCGLLLDINNVYVSCFNAGTNPIDYLERFPYEAVVQLHLAGHTHCGNHIVDTHDQPVSDGVWDLFSWVWNQLDTPSILLEWDGDVPTFDLCHQELLKAQTHMDRSFNPDHFAFEMQCQHASKSSTPLDHLVPNVMGAVSANSISNGQEL